MCAHFAKYRSMLAEAMVINLLPSPHSTTRKTQRQIILLPQMTSPSALPMQRSNLPPSDPPALTEKLISSSWAIQIDIGYTIHGRPGSSDAETT